MEPVEFGTADFEPVIAGVGEAFNADEFADVVDGASADDADAHGGAVAQFDQEITSAAVHFRFLRTSRDRHKNAIVIAEESDMPRSLHPFLNRIEVIEERQKIPLLPGAMHEIFDFVRDIHHPIEDRVFEEMMAHLPHACRSFLPGKKERLVDRMREALDVIGIDEECLWDLFRGAGKFAQYQCAGFLRIAGDILLGDEIHAVLQRAHYGEIGEAVQRGKLRMRLFGANEDDRFPRTLSKSDIDAVYLGHHLLLERAIRWECFARRSAYLKECERSPPARVELKKEFKSVEPLEDALRVIAPLHPDAALLPRKIVTVANGLHGFLCTGSLCKALNRVRIHADRERADAHRPFSENNLLGGVADGKRKLVLNALEKIMAEQIDMHPDEVAAEHPKENCLALRVLSEDFPWWPRDVPKLEDGCPGESIAHHRRSGREVVILKPYHPLLSALHALEFRFYRAGEAPVCLLVYVPLLPAKAYALRLRVAERPERLVPMAVVESLHLLRTQPHAAQTVFFLSRREQEAVAMIHEIGRAHV